MNLLLNDGTRVHLFISGNISKMKNEAGVIADFLSVPLLASPNSDVNLPISDFHTNLRWVRLVKLSDDVMMFRYTALSVLFVSLPAIIGLLIFILMFFVYLAGSVQLSYLLAILFISIFATIVSLVMINRYVQIVVFDKKTGVYKKKISLIRYYEDNYFFPVSQISSFQILEVLTKVDWKPFICWELNMIMKSQTRVHLLCTGDRNKLIDEANELGMWLDKPIYVHNSRAK